MSFKKMKVILNCSYFFFHRDYMLNIKNELESRGHTAIITESSDKINVPAKIIENFYIKNHSDSDFTILPDEACSVIGGKGIYINHAILPVVPQHDFYYDRSFNECINKNTFYMFLPSQDVSDIYLKELQLNKPVKIVGLPKLDNVFKKRKFDFMSIPLNKLFLETDTNNTILIEDIYKNASQKFIISEDDLKEKIYSNFTTLFKKDGR